MTRTSIKRHVKYIETKKWGRHAVTHQLDPPTADMSMLHYTATSANSSVPHTSDLYQPSRHIILYTKLYQATKRKERCARHKKGTPSVAWGAVQMDMHERPVLLNKRACTYSTSGPFVYTIHSIQNLKSPKNARSIQTSTLWAGLTDTNDVPMDTSKPQRLWTHAQSHSKQMTSEHWYWYYESRKNHATIKMTFWPPNTRYHKAWGAPALIRAALYRPYMPRLV